MTIKEVEVILKGINESLSAISERLNTLEKLESSRQTAQVTPPASATPAQPTVAQVEASREMPKTLTDDELIIRELGGLSDPIPQALREIVDLKLNQHFGIHLRHDIGSVVLTILVPKKYSPLTQPHWEMMHFDKRTVVLNSAEGETGAKMYAEKVYNSFNPEIQAMIVADRGNK